MKQSYRKFLVRLNTTGNNNVNTWVEKMRRNKAGTSFSTQVYMYLFLQMPSHQWLLSPIETVDGEEEENSFSIPGKKKRIENKEKRIINERSSNFDEVLTSISQSLQNEGKLKKNS